MLEFRVARAAAHTVVGCLLVALAESAGAVPEPGLRATYDFVRTETNPTAKDGAASTVTKGTLAVRMTPTVLAVREGDTERVVNFHTGRIVILDHAQRSATNYSLYSQPAFREMELVNRAAMSRGLAEALGQAYDQVDAEAELGMLGSPPAKLKMSELQRAGERVFVLNDREMVSIAPATLQVPPALEGAFGRLLLFEAQLHPKVREVLAAGRQLPARLNFGFRLFQAETTVSWELREAVLEDLDLGAVASAYPTAPVTEMPIMVTAWRVVTGQAGSPPTPKDYEERAARLLAEGRAFESFLVGMEAVLATGDMATAVLKRAREAGGEDPRMQAFAHSVDLAARHGKPEESLRLINDLDAATLQGGAAIHVQRANQYVRMREGDRALQEFERALGVNPFIVGAWHDAGWMFVQEFATSLGWTCWDAARSSAASAPALKDVTNLEIDLRSKHPEFF